MSLDSLSYPDLLASLAMAVVTLALALHLVYTVLKLGTIDYIYFMERAFFNHCINGTLTSVELNHVTVSPGPHGQRPLIICPMVRYINGNLATVVYGAYLR